MTLKEWTAHVCKRGTSGDQVHDILNDWDKAELVLLRELWKAQDELLIYIKLFGDV